MPGVKCEIPDSNRTNLPESYFRLFSLEGLSSAIARISDKPVNNVILDITTRDKPDKLVFSGIRRFTMTEVQAATGHFKKSNIITSGYHSDMYRGLIDGGTRKVAIKRWTGGISCPQADIIRMEIEVQSQLHDLNLVSLIGYYMDEHEAILVYDYMANGSLHHHLYETKSRALSWEKRLSICLSIAQALQHLRIKWPSVYRYFKPTHIFLNQNWDAKVSGFNFPNLALNDAIEKQYIDPESHITGRFSEKSDVYSFGVLLLEFLCGRSGMIYSKTEGTARIILVQWFENSLGHLAIDPYVSRPMSPECFKTYADLALDCLSHESINRPTMEDVVIKLEWALYQQKTWQDSEDERFDVEKQRQRFHIKTLFQKIKFPVMQAEFLKVEFCSLHTSKED